MEDFKGLEGVGLRLDTIRGFQLGLIHGSGHQVEDGLNTLVSHAEFEQ